MKKKNTATKPYITCYDKQVANFSHTQMDWVCRKLGLEKDPKGRVNLYYCYTKNKEGEMLSIMLFRHGGVFPMTGNLSYLVTIRDKHGDEITRKSGYILSYEGMREFVCFASEYKSQYPLSRW